jgi:protein TonB
MKISIMALYVLLSFVMQSESFEKQALSIVSRVSASSLDEKLPDAPFGDWLNNLVGKDAGVIWQLAECGAVAAGGGDQDTAACAEATVRLPGGDVVILGISVGTFKKGLAGEPVFRGAALRTKDRLYRVRRLRDLPMALRSPESLDRILPDLQADARGAHILPLRMGPALASIRAEINKFGPGLAVEKEAPPPPKPIQQSAVELVEASVIKMVKPVYPPGARAIGASGKVDVRIVISETGRVIEATAISGHVLLRKAAVDAALQWVFKPGTRNGAPARTESVIPFIFNSGRQE